MMKIQTISVLALATLLLSSCGTVSDVKPVTGSEIQAKGSYDSLIVGKFRDATQPDGFSTWTAEEQREHRENVRNACERISSRIADETRSTGRFKHVGNRKGPGSNLLVEGEITHFDNGVASLRLWVGMGAGSAYLDGSARFKDAATGRELGTIVIDKNSWPLGGGAASTQTADRFAELAASKIAEQAVNFAR